MNTINFEYSRLKTGLFIVGCTMGVIQPIWLITMLGLFEPDSILTQSLMLLALFMLISVYCFFKLVSLLRKIHSGEQALLLSEDGIWTNLRGMSTSPVQIPWSDYVSVEARYIGKNYFKHIIVSTNEQGLRKNSQLAQHRNVFVGSEMVFCPFVLEGSSSDIADVIEEYATSIRESEVGDSSDHALANNVCKVA